MGTNGRVKWLLRKAGYELHRVSRACYAKDPFIDQQKLLSDTRVEAVLDLGANAGQTATTYRGMFPEATVYSFEPFPESFAGLCKRFERDTLVRPIKLAVANRSGQRSFYVYDDKLTNSLLPGLETEGFKDSTCVAVPVTTVDEFCEKEQIEKIQILKMDIQGGELMALEGASQKLKERSIDLIYTELLVTPLYTGQAFYFEICEYLSRYGYVLFDLYNCAYKEVGRLEWCDAIFVNSERVGRQFGMNA